ncbi:MAG: DUF1801 domain-containing protein [Ferruginibacter sp.]|nr:DUF1801 domain-containing protein [Chitinophagaceae bacterium]
MATAIKTSPAAMNKYIAGFPEPVRKLLEKIRATIRKAAPGAEETINYGVPTFTLNGNLVHFAAFKNHIGFYPAPSGIVAYKKELSIYEGAKGSVKFPIDKPIPFDLISKIVQFRVKENEELALAKANKKSPPKKKTAKLTDEEQVKAYMNKLGPVAKSEIEAVRKIIKGAHPKLSERIKWNAPSYYYKEDIVTFGPYKTHKLLLVFHHPAVVKLRSKLLQGDYKDRRLVHFKDKGEATKNKKELSAIINEIVNSIDKK